MQEKRLHVISFNNPYPPSYGGIIEVYYKIKALHAIGYTIYLHCFVKELPANDDNLKQIAEEVYFYKTSYNPFAVFSGTPLSVASRNNKELVDNLLKHNAPILCESLKTTLLMDDKRLADYPRILRMHNIEHDYFNGLSATEKNPLRKLLYKIEGRCYAKFEHRSRLFDLILTLSHYENDYAASKFNNVHYIPVFHGNNDVTPLDNFGKYALYHGDLTISDNRAAARYLIEVFKESLPDYRLIIASRTNREFIERLIGPASNIKFEQIRGFSHLKKLFNEAQINLVLSFQRSGTKLKLINALYHSRFCIINENIMDDPAVASLCTVINSKEDIINAVKELEATEYKESSRRQKVLNANLDDIENAKKIDALIQKLL